MGGVAVGSLVGTVVGGDLGMLVAVGMLDAVGRLAIVLRAGCIGVIAACSFWVVLHALRLTMEMRHIMRSRAALDNIRVFPSYGEQVSHTLIMPWFEVGRKKLWAGIQTSARLQGYEPATETIIAKST